ncbi:hypothetical protein V6Z11_A03G213400 [Gossypium hirsutum]
MAPAKHRRGLSHYRLPCLATGTPKVSVVNKGAT